MDPPVVFLAAVALLLVLTPLAGPLGVFLVAAVPVVDFRPLVVEAVEGRVVPVGFLSPTLVGVLEAGAPAGFLEAAEVGVLFLSGVPVVVVVVFLTSPLVWGLDTPLVRRLWAVLGREPGPVLVRPVVPVFVLTGALLVVLALGSSEALLSVLVAGLSLAGSGWGSPWSISPAAGWPVTSSIGSAAWLGSSPMGGDASVMGLDSSVSIGSSTAVATPSGFISPQWWWSVSAEERWRTRHSHADATGLENVW